MLRSIGSGIQNNIGACLIQSSIRLIDQGNLGELHSTVKIKVIKNKFLGFVSWSCLGRERGSSGSPLSSSTNKSSLGYGMACGDKKAAHLCLGFRVLFVLRVQFELPKRLAEHSEHVSPIIFPDDPNDIVHDRTTISNFNQRRTRKVDRR